MVSDGKNAAECYLHNETRDWKLKTIVFQLDKGLSWVLVIEKLTKLYKMYSL